MLGRVLRLPASLGRATVGGAAFLPAFAVAAAGVGLGRAITTTYLPVLLDRIDQAPGLIGAVMMVNAVAGFAVPLAVGLWSDRAANGRLGPRLPFVIGGTLFSVGGLVAIALGTESSYLVLGLAAGVVYVGLNATATAHRAIVVDGFDDRRRPAATGAQELAMLVGALAGVLAGGALAASSAPALFVLAAAALPLLAVPTIAAAARLPRPPGVGAAAEAGGARPRPRDFVAAMRRAGPRRILVAQVLWVMGYAALPTFMILYADAVLGLGVGAASVLTAGFAALTGVGMVIAGRQPPERVFPMLLAGTAMLGLGLVSAAPAASLATAAAPFAAAAFGAGLVTALGFPYFARFIPRGEEGRYSGLYFASRAIASAVALPLAGLAISATGSYRALLLQGAVAVVAMAPLLLAERRREPAAVERRTRARPRRVAAIIPCFSAVRLRAVVEETLPFADRVIVVDDGTPPDTARDIESLRGLPGVRVLRLEANAGKGDAVEAGASAALDDPDEPDALIVLDADGQHPPDRIPAFVAAAEHADLVVGDRSGDRRPMPRIRRFTNTASSGLLALLLRRRVPDSQCGMRLIRTKALRDCPLPRGRFEAETLHLRAAVRHGLSVGWVPVPAIYHQGATSTFRPLADTGRVLLAIFGRPAPRWRLRLPSAQFARNWGRRLCAVIAGCFLVAALLPLLAALDTRLFFTLHALGDGPDWVYWTFDPHMRNYFILGGLILLAAALTRVRPLVGVAVTLLVAAYFSNALVQLFYEVYDRPRPEELLEGLFLTSHGRSWAHIESFPSGHLVITTAVAAAGASMVPALRGALVLYLGVVALTRVTFGAHFPLDVVVGAVFGYEVGRFSVALAHAAGALRVGPARLLPRFHRPGGVEPAPVEATAGEP